MSCTPLYYEWAKHKGPDTWKPVSHWHKHTVMFKGLSWLCIWNKDFKTQYHSLNYPWEMTSCKRNSKFLPIQGRGTLRDELPLKVLTPKLWFIYLTNDPTMAIGTTCYLNNYHTPTLWMCQLWALHPLGVYAGMQLWRPIPLFKNVNHHCMADHTSGYGHNEARSIIQGIQGRPGFTTLLACWRWPISDSSCHFCVLLSSPIILLAYTICCQVQCSKEREQNLNPLSSCHWDL